MVIFTIICCHGNSLQFTHMNEKEIPGVLLIFTVNAKSLNPKLKQILRFSFFILLQVYAGSHLNRYLNRYLNCSLDLTLEDKFHISAHPCIKPGSHMPPTYLGHGHRHGLGQRCGICEHLSPTHSLSQALIAGLPAKLNSALNFAGKPAVSQVDQRHIRTRLETML